MAHDHFAPLFPMVPAPSPGPSGPIPTGMFTVWPPQGAVLISQEEADRLRTLIADFRAAVDAAKVVDKLTAKPDCADPEKLKLEERVAALEAQLAALRGALAQS